AALSPFMEGAQMASGQYSRRERPLGDRVRISSNPCPTGWWGGSSRWPLFHGADATDDSGWANYRPLYQGDWPDWRQGTCCTLGGHLCPGTDCERLSQRPLANHGSPDCLRTRQRVMAPK